MRARDRSAIAGEWVDAVVLRGEPAADAAIAGPAVVELPESTLFLPPGWSGGVDAHGTVVAEVTR